MFVNENYYIHNHATFGNDTNSMFGHVTQKFNELTSVSVKAELPLPSGRRPRLHLQRHQGVHQYQTFIIQPPPMNI